MNPPEPPNPASILARLRNRARTLNFPPDQMLLLYCLEGFLARLSQSPMAEWFVLKGGLSLYSRFGAIARPTRDIDLASRMTTPTHEQLCEAVLAIAAIHRTDGIEYDPHSLRTRPLTEAAEGLGISLVARFGQSQQTIHMDISSGNAITPGPVQLGFPSLLGEHPHPLLMYPLETVVAEKYAAAIELGVGNTRMKDFYDLWYILRDASPDPQFLHLALVNTFRSRETELVGSMARWRALGEAAPLVTLWTAYLRSNRLQAPEDFAQIIEHVASRLEAQ